MHRHIDITWRGLVRYALQGCAVAVVVSTVIVYLTSDRTAWGRVGAIPWHMPATVLLVIAGSWLCSAGRLCVLSRALGHRLTYLQGLVTTLSADFGVAATPGGAGGTLVRAAFLNRAGLGWASGASVLAVDALFDVAFVFLVTPFAFYVVLNDPEWHRIAGVASFRVHWHVLFGVATLLLIAVAVAVHGGRLARRMERLASAFAVGRRISLPARLRWARWRLQRMGARAVANIRGLVRTRRMALLAGFLLTCGQWSFRYSILPIVLAAFIDLPNPIPLVVIQGLVLAFASLIMVPGGAGGVEVLMLIVLRALTGPTLAGVVLILWRFFTYYVYLLAGGTVFFLACGRLRRIFPARADQSR